MSKPYLEIFNPDFRNHHGGRDLHFHPFPRLPTELRLRIWQTAMKRERIITIQLNTVSNVVSEDNAPRYHAFVDGNQLMSKFMRVNREARKTILQFYRVNIPCNITTEQAQLYLDGSSSKPGVLHFIPEYDFLHIKVWITGPTVPNDCLVDFLHDLKRKYDPRQVGICNLAVEACDLDIYEISHRECKNQAVFVSMIEQLKEVFFINKTRGGRTVFGWMSGLHTPETFFNRSYPLMPITSTFERQGHDPRPIDHDLKRLCLGALEPRRGYQKWRKLLRMWGVSSVDIKYSHLVAFLPPYSLPICTRLSATRWLEMEDDMWTSTVNPKIGKLKFQDKDEGFESIKPALGFWLFPLNAFGPFHPNGEILHRDGERTGREGIDVSAFWPELAFSSLP